MNISDSGYEAAKLLRRNLRDPVAGHVRMIVVIQERFLAGESIASLSRDYAYSPTMIEAFLRAFFRARGCKTKRPPGSESEGRGTRNETRD